MYTETIEIAKTGAVSKVKFCRDRFKAYLVHSALAGVYVGFGLLLALTVAAPFAEAKSPATQLVMGATFGVALSLVVMAGSDLFTGNVMFMSLGKLCKAVSWRDWRFVLGVSFLGNLLGSMLLALLVFLAGSFALDPHRAFILTVAARKMHLGFWPLFFRGILCNWLVVLALWSGMRIKSESARLMMIFWCLLAFVGSGYEHSVANMTLLTLANLIPHDGNISWSLMLNNLVPVTLGNLVSGSLFTSWAYWYVNSGKVTKPALTMIPGTGTPPLPATRGG